MDKKLVLIFWLLFIAVYSINLTLLPIFEDEAQYLLLAEAIQSNPVGNFFLYPQNGLLPFFGWMVAIFNFFIKDSLVAGRIVNVLFASSLVWWLYSISQLYKLSKTFFFICFLFLLTSPILLLNARVAMLDTAVLALTAWYLYFTLKIFLFPTKKDYIGLLVTLLAALLTKATVLFGIPALIILILIEIYKKKKITKEIIYPILVYGLAFGVLGGLFFFFSQQIHRDSGSSLVSNFSMENFLERIRINSWLTLNWTTVYYQPALVALLEYIVFFKYIKNKKVFFILGFWMVTAMAATITLNRFYYPRHILILLAPLTIFVGGIWAYIPKLISIPLLLLIFLPRIFFDWNIVFTPQKAALAAEDRFSFYEDYTSGVGVEEIAVALSKLSKDGPIVVWLDGSYIMRYGLRRELENNANIIFKSFNPFVGSFFDATGDVIKDDNFTTYALANRWYPKNAGKLKIIRSFDVSFRHRRVLYQML